MITPRNNNSPETPKPMPLKYKHRDIKVYSSDEWMADNSKKYRKVFDRWETTYQRAEFSFFNKLFDEEDWNASIRIKCFFHNGNQKESPGGSRECEFLLSRNFKRELRAIK